MTGPRVPRAPGGAASARLLLLAAAAVVAVGLVVLGSHSVGSTRADAEVPADVSATCGRCHLVPGPKELPESGWELLLGRKPRIMKEFATNAGLPDTSVPTGAQFHRARDYYLTRALTQDQLMGPPAPTTAETGLFAVEFGVPAVADAPIQGYLDVLADAAGIVASDFGAGGLRLFDRGGATAGFVGVGITPARIERDGEALLVPLMEDPSGGKLVWVELDRNRPDRSVVDTLLDGLQRPIRAYPASLDGQRGIVVEEFGIDRGGLRFWPRTDRQDGRPELAEPQTLVDAPGVVGSALADLDGDGSQELVVLVSQQAEQLLLFPEPIRRPGASEVLFQGSPGYGFNGLALADIDGDSRLDIVAINGDNYDLETGPLKPYHGIRIFRNRGGLRFDPPVFHPFQGVVAVVPGDYDLDGDLDLVALSLFPDYRLSPYESAVLFEQDNGEFIRRVIPPGRGGRWVAGAAIDWDGDGDLDLILAGAYSNTTAADQRWSENAGPDPRTLLLLENTTRPGR